MAARPEHNHRKHAAYLSLAAALGVLTLKLIAYFLSGSVALLADAAESVVNVAAAIAVLVSIHLAAQPPDYAHPYGHDKAEYLSSAFEGALILLAAGMILITSAERLFNPEPLINVQTGVTVAILATLINGIVAMILKRESKRSDSAALESNARHLLTDVWTSIGVIVAVVLVSVTNIAVLDPLIAVLVGLNIIREGVLVITTAFSRLLDERLPEEEEAIILSLLDNHQDILGYHRLRTRRSGMNRFAEFDVFVDPSLTVAQAHDLVVLVEDDLHALLPNMITTIHIEPFVQGQREGASTPKDEYAY